MLKIEVIKFEAQDVITTSVATPEVDAPAEPQCICSEEVPYRDCYINGTHAECEAQPYDGQHKCVDYSQPM